MKKENKARLEFRIKALEKLGVILSDKIKEICETDENLQNLLISMDFLNNAHKMSSDTINHIAKKLNLTIPDNIIVVCSGKQKIICEKGENIDKYCLESTINETSKTLVSRKKREEEQNSLLLSPATTGSISKLFKEQEISKIFKEEDIARIKLQILTSTSEAEKIEAVRLLNLLPIPAEDQVILSIKALFDPSKKVKVEALNQLRILGVSPDLVDILKAIASEEKGKQLYGLEHLNTIIRKLAVAEKDLVINFLFSIIESETNAEILKETIKCLEKVAPTICRNTNYLKYLTKRCVEALLLNYSGLENDIHNLFKSITVNLDAEKVNIIFDEVKVIEDYKIKGLFLQCILLAKLEGSLLDDVIKTSVEHLNVWKDITNEYRRLASHLVLYPIPALRIIIDTYPKCSIESKPFFIRTIENILANIKDCNDVPENIYNKLIELIIDIIRNGSRQERWALFETNIIVHPLLKVQHKQKIVFESANKLYEFALNPNVINSCEVLFHKLGPIVIEPFKKILKESLYDINKEVTSKVLPHIISKIDFSQKEYAKEAGILYKLFRELWEDETKLRENMVYCLGKLCSAKGVHQIIIQETIDFLKENMLKSPHPWAYIEALGCIAAGYGTDIETRIELTNFILSIFKTPLPDVSWTSKETQEGDTVIQIRSSAVFYTDFIPALIKSLENIILCPQISDALRNNILEVLIDKWMQVSEYKEIWGPRSVSFFAQTLGNIGENKLISDEGKIKILKALRNHINNTVVVLAVSKILLATKNYEWILTYCEEYIQRLLSLLESYTTTTDYEDTFIIIKALASLLQKEKLATTIKETKKLRQKILNAIFFCLDANIPNIKYILHDILKIKGLSPKEEKLIKEKIAKE